MDLGFIPMRELERNIKVNGRMIYGMEKGHILLVFHLKLLLKEIGKKVFCMEKHRLFIEIKISL
jgi:hypothetical protein